MRRPLDRANDLGCDVSRRRLGAVVLGKKDLNLMMPGARRDLLCKMCLCKMCRPSPRESPREAQERRLRVAAKALGVGAIPLWRALTGGFGRDARHSSVKPTARAREIAPLVTAAIEHIESALRLGAGFDPGTSAPIAKQPPRWAGRLRCVPARPQRLMDRIAPGDDQSQRRTAEPGSRRNLREEPSSSSVLK